MYSYERSFYAGPQSGQWAPSSYGNWQPAPHMPADFQPYAPGWERAGEVLRDYGPNPFVIDINRSAGQNDAYRTTLWTGEHFQVTLMSLHPGEDIGLEIHPENDQFLRIEQGQGTVQMGKNKENLDFVRNVRPGSAIVVPAGTWHNIINAGNTPIKLYSIYAPPHHKYGTVHRTKAEAEAEEE